MKKKPRRRSSQKTSRANKTKKHTKLRYKNIKTMNPDEIDKIFEKRISSLLKDLYLTTSKKVLFETSEKLVKIIDEYKGYRYQAIARNEEYDANTFFAMQCATSSIRSAYLMMGLIKDEKNVDAWCKLIDAYDYINISIKIVEKFISPLVSLEKLNETHGLWVIRQRLENFEKTLFRPHGVYNSSGLVESVGNCSICGEPFHRCDHTEGDIIMGRLCRRVNRKIIRADHSAIVKSPKDRRCIFTSSYNEKGIPIDFFSREPLTEPQDKNTYNAIIHVLNVLDID